MGIFERYADKTSRLNRGTVRIQPAADGAQDQPRIHKRFHIPSTDFPLPDLVKVSLLLVGCKDLGRWEKTAWEIPFDFGDIKCLIASRKLGMSLELWFSEDTAEADHEVRTNQVLAALKRLIAIAETDVIYPEIRRAVDRGEVALRNIAPKLRSQYKYFRDGAELAYAGRGRLAPAPPESVADDAHSAVSSFAHDFSKSIAAEKEGSFNAVAMVNSFFSYLEHYSSLAVAFTQLDMKSFDLMRFLGDRWDAKLKAVLDIRDPNVKKLYDQMHRVAELYRNPMSHGGHDKRGPLIGVKLPEIGYLPMLLTGIEETPTFQVFGSVGSATFAELTTLFDEIEEVLTGPALDNAGEWIRCGLDVYFNDEERSQYNGTVESIRELMEQRSDEMDRLANMDW